MVDDEEHLARHYALILEQAGMTVRAIHDPLLVMDTVHDMEPELVLMDLYMPGCTGFELAQVLRQRDTLAGVPIIFLSSESRMEKQRKALKLGGDDFLTKPVDAAYLVSTVSSRIARARVTSYGLSDEIGPVDYSDNSDPYSRPNHVSEETSKRIEEEVRKLIQHGKDEARRIMTDYKDQWTAIAEGLLEYETLTGEELNDLLNGKPPTRPDEPDEPQGPASAVPVIGKRRKNRGDEPGGEPEPA